MEDFFTLWRSWYERKAALGTAAYVPRICGDRICIDCIDAVIICDSAKPRSVADCGSRRN